MDNKQIEQIITSIEGRLDSTGVDDNLRKEALDVINMLKGLLEAA